MGFLIIPIVLLLAYVVWYCYSRQFVGIGEIYVVMCSNYLAIIEESGVIENKNDLSSLSPKYMETNYLRASYDPQDPKSFFEQMEYAYLYACDLYGKIEYREYNFRSDDWKNIQLYRRALEDIHSKMRYAKWLNFGLK